jgi:hypothetical protein
MALPIVEVPKYSVTIPSNGESVVYRPYLVKEEKILMIAMESENQEQVMRAVKEVIAACTFNKINVDNLTVFDMEYVFLKLRSKSVGEVSKIGIKCGECSALNDIEVQLDILEVSKPEEDNSVVMITDKIGVKLRYPTVKDANVLVKYSGTEAAMKTIIACIDNIFDDEKVYPAGDSTPKELEQFVDSLNSEQFKKMQKFFETMPSLSHDAKFTCIKCGHQNELLIKGLANFFG